MNSKLGQSFIFFYKFRSSKTYTNRHSLMLYVCAVVYIKLFSYNNRFIVIGKSQKLCKAIHFLDTNSFNFRKDNVLKLWSYLLELLKARRLRLELSLSIQKIFQEMLYILDWMEEIKVQLLLRGWLMSLVYNI